MELTLTEVEDEFVKQDPFIKVSLLDDDGRIEITALGECRVHYIKMLAVALDMITEELNDEERQELDAWLDED